MIFQTSQGGICDRSLEGKYWNAFTEEMSWHHCIWFQTPRMLPLSVTVTTKMTKNQRLKTQKVDISVVI